MTSNITGTNVRSTAATRLVFEDLQVPEVIKALEQSSSDIQKLIDEVGIADRLVITTTESRDNLIDTLTHNATSRYEFELNSPDHTDVTKRVQAELDRRVKAALTDSESLADLESLLVERKLQANIARSAFDAEKFNHRTLTSKANLTTATLQFLAASKTARAAALAHLSEV